MMTDAEAYLEDCRLQMKKLRTKAEKSFVQVNDQQFFQAIDPDANSIAVIMKHLAGNMRSRWTDFLTTDGEKPDRNRDDEFETGTKETRGSITALWEEGWTRLESALESLKPDDLLKTVTVRGEPHTVLQAINRQMTHYAAHVGQIILLAKHFAGSEWKTLSIPKGKSREYEVSKDDKPYRP